MEALKELSLFNQIEKKLFLFFITFCATQMVFIESHFVYLIPIICLSFVIGKSEIILCCMSLVVGSIIFNDYSIIVFGGLFVLLLSLMIPIYSMKTRFISIVAGIYLFFIQSIFLKSQINTSVLYMMVGMFLTYTMLNNASYLVHQKSAYKPQAFYFFGLLLFYAIYPLMQLSSVFFMVWLRLLALIILFVSNFQTAYMLVMCTSILLLIHNSTMMTEIMLMIIPFSFFHFLAGKTKLSIAVFYILSHLIIPFIAPNSIKPYVFEVVFSSISFMMIPSQIKLLCEKEVSEDQQLTQITSTQRKLTRQLENYSDLFFKIAHSFDDMRLETSSISYLGYIQENLCQQCINHDECFNKQKGDHRLIKLLKKGIIEGLNKEEQHYVECYCVKMAQYKKLMTEQHKLYIHQKEMNDQYQVLKHHLYDQLSLVGELLKNYSENIQWNDVYHVNHIKELLEAYHYKIWHIHKEELSMKTFQIEIGMTEVTKKEVYEIVLPILEKTMNTKLRVIKFENNASQLGYTHLILSNHHHYDLILGYQQISKDRDFCGDSYLSFQYHSKTFVALSDGMGFGKKAHEESDLTLDVFSRLVKSGIHLDDCIQTVNALLRIKNRIEMFTTLDVLMFDSAVGEGTFIKNGAMPSYIYRNSELIKIEPNALPIGILHEVKTYQETLPLHEDDLILMISDGFDLKFENIISDMIKQHISHHTQFIADKIMAMMLEGEYIDDDATIVVMRVKKVEN